jgi:hypothetical protein
LLAQLGGSGTLYVFLKPLSQYEGVTVDESFINAGNLREAGRARSVGDNTGIFADRRLSLPEKDCQVVQPLGVAPRKQPIAWAPFPLNDPAFTSTWSTSKKVPRLELGDELHVQFGQQINPSVEGYISHARPFGPPATDVEVQDSRPKHSTRFRARKTSRHGSCIHLDRDAFYVGRQLIHDLPMLPQARSV